MKLSAIKRKNATHYYITESFREGDKVSSRTIKKLGTDKEICEKHHVTDARAWALEQVKKANGKLKTKSGTSSTKQNTQHQSESFQGINLIKRICKQIGIYDFLRKVEKDEGTKKDELFNLFLMLMLNRLYFPESYNFHAPFFFEGYFKNHNFSYSHLKTLFSAFATRNDELFDLLQKHNSYAYYGEEAFLASIPITTLPSKCTTKSKYALQILYDSNYTPITMTHSFLSPETNSKRLAQALKPFTFVDIYANKNYAFLKKPSLLKRSLPKKIDLRNFYAVSYEKACELAQRPITFKDTWEKIDIKNAKDFKKYPLLNNVRFKQFKIPTDSSHVLTVLYGKLFMRIDINMKLQISCALNGNFQCDPQIKEDIARDIGNEVYTDNTIGYRFYVTPKNINVRMLVYFDYYQCDLPQTFNAVDFHSYYSRARIGHKKYMIAYHTIFYLAHLLASLILLNSKSYISGLLELSHFLHSLDAPDFSEHLKTHIDQILYRIDI